MFAHNCGEGVKRSSLPDQANAPDTAAVAPSGLSENAACVAVVSIAWLKPIRTRALRATLCPCGSDREIAGMALVLKVQAKAMAPLGLAMPPA